MRVNVTDLSRISNDTTVKSCEADDNSFMPSPLLVIGITKLTHVHCFIKIFSQQNFLILAEIAYTEPSWETPVRSARKTDKNIGFNFTDNFTGMWLLVFLIFSLKLRFISFWCNFDAWFGSSCRTLLLFCVKAGFWKVQKIKQRVLAFGHKFWVETKAVLKATKEIETTYPDGGHYKGSWQ